MHLHTAERVEPLAARLSEVLSVAPADPMTREWVAVPSAGMQRWLSLELARHLGAAVGAQDGVAANFEFGFPGSMRQRVLDAGRADDDPDPWAVERLAWAILDIADRHPEDRHLVPLNRPAAGCSRYGTARRIADLFDRYHVHRPEMIRSWAAGRPVDDSGRGLPDHHLWQPHLWLLVRDRLRMPSPPERIPDLLDRLRAGQLEVDLPERIAMFGLSVLPGGAGFLELVDGVAATRDVHLFLLEPSAAMSSAAMSNAVGPGATRSGATRLRSDDDSGALVAHPLLRSWGRLPRETAVLIADRFASGFSGPVRVISATDEPPPDSLLRHLAADIRADRAPTATLRLLPGDNSIQLHACHGSTRQVEVLRDAILHLLADPLLRLSEDDIVVLCPALERFAPIIEAVFGPSADLPPVHPATPGGRPARAHAPALRYRIADRSIGTPNQVLEATSALLDLAAGRFDVPSVMDFISSSPVRHRFGLTDEDIARVSEWVGATHVAWGLDAEHRAPLGVPVTITNNTWRSALDRLAVGAAIYDDGTNLALGDVVPFGVEGDDAALAGRFADLMGQLADLAGETNTPRRVGDWVSLLRGVSSRLFAMTPDDSWQMQALHRLLRTISETCVIDGDPSSTMLQFVDVRRLLRDHLGSSTGRPDFFRGGITVTSLTPLRWIPHRVVCLIGMDQNVFSAGAVDGDDLAVSNPQLGDRDQRGEMRQALLESLLTAGDHLIIVRDGHDVRTNHEIPAAVAVAELTDTLSAMIDPAERSTFEESLEIHHPRQPFDVRCFVPDAIVTGRWSFDPGALAGAEARLDRDEMTPAEFLPTPLVRRADADIALEDLHSFLRHPVKEFLTQRLQLRLPRREDGANALLPVDIGGLDGWAIGHGLLNALLAGRSLEEWKEMELRVGSLPPGVLGERDLATVVGRVEQLVATTQALGFRAGPGEAIPVIVPLSDGTRVTGTVLSGLDGAAPGPARVSYSASKPSHRVAAWLDLVALVATDPQTNWRSVTVNRDDKDRPPKCFDLVPTSPVGAEGRAANASEAVEVAVDCYRRGLVEPLPLFAGLSPALYNGTASKDHWHGHRGNGDRSKDENGVVFGSYDFDELKAIEAREGDPEGPGNRVERFASYLWSAIERSVMDRPATDDTAGEVKK